MRVWTKWKRLPGKWKIKQTGSKAPISRKPPVAKKSVPAAKAAPIGKVIAFNNIKVPAAVPIGKQVVVGQRIQSFQGGSLNARDFYNFLIKTLGQQTTTDALPGIYATLSSARSKELQNYISSKKWEDLDLLYGNFRLIRNATVTILRCKFLFHLPLL